MQIRGTGFTSRLYKQGLQHTKYVLTLFLTKLFGCIVDSLKRLVPLGCSFTIKENQSASFLNSIVTQPKYSYTHLSTSATSSKTMSSKA